MKTLAIITTSLFLFSNLSVAQVRYALTNPVEISAVLINFAMAFCIYMIVINLSKIRKNHKKATQILKKNQLLGRNYRVS